MGIPVPIYRFLIGVTQLKALKVERNGPTPPFSPLPTALWAVGRGEKNPCPHGKRTA